MSRPKCDDVTDVVFVFLAFVLKLETRCDGLRVIRSDSHFSCEFVQLDIL